LANGIFAPRLDAIRNYPYPTQSAGFLGKIVAVPQLFRLMLTILRETDLTVICRKAAGKRILTIILLFDR
jgi:hypothetical protein